MTWVLACVVERTNLVLANKSESLRTTVPASIIRQFGLKSGDKLEWSIKADNGDLILQVKTLSILHDQDIDRMK